MVLHFGFVTNPRLVTHQCFKCACTASRLSFSHSTPPANRPEVDKKLAGDTVGTAVAPVTVWNIPDQRDVPYHTVSQSEIKAQGKEEEMEMLIVTLFVLSGNQCVCQGTTSQQVDKDLPAHEKQ